MDPKLTISFSGNYDKEDLALLIEAIAGDLRQGRTYGSAEEYAWKIA
jgi:hypothetical protein